LCLTPYLVCFFMAGSFLIKKKARHLSEWVSDCCLTPIFQLYHGENKLIFNKNNDEVLQQINMLSLIFL
jgi:hypothetical protein